MAQRAVETGDTSCAEEKEQNENTTKHNYQKSYYVLLVRHVSSEDIDTSSLAMRLINLLLDSANVRRDRCCRDLRVAFHQYLFTSPFFLYFMLVLYLFVVIICVCVYIFVCVTLFRFLLFILAFYGFGPLHMVVSDINSRSTVGKTEGSSRSPSRWPWSVRQSNELLQGDFTPRCELEMLLAMIRSFYSVFVVVHDSTADPWAVIAKPIHTV